MLYGDISDIKVLFDVWEVLASKKSIIQQLYPDKRIQQSKLSRQTGIQMSNLSNDLKLLKKHKLIDISKGNTVTGFRANYIKLSKKTLETLASSSQVLQYIDKKPLADDTNFKQILDGLLEPKTCIAAANAVQIYSRKYHIPFNAGFFEFISDNWENKSLRDRLTVLMKSANNLVSELNEEEKKQVIVLLGEKLDDIITKGKNKGLKNESEKFLEKVGLYNLPYDSLKDRYLAAFEEGDPSLFRSLIARYYKDKVMDLWLALMQRQGSALVGQESKYDEEYAHLSSLF